MVESSSDPEYDVIVLGGGNAGFSAATTAAQTLRKSHPTSKPKVLLVEKSSLDSSGGNTFYTAGAYRFCFSSFSDLRPLLSHDGRPGVPDDLAARIEMDPYTETDFHRDLDRVTKGRADPELASVLVGRSREAVDWIKENGGTWELSFHRQAYEVDGRFRFWGGLVVCFAGGGKGLVQWHQDLAEREGIEVWYGAEVVGLVHEDEGRGTVVTGVEVLYGESKERRRLRARGGVVIATGGFQADAELRSKWLGAPWAAAHVRGSATNTGSFHRLLLLPSASDSIRAKRAGHFEGCHSVCWDAGSPAQGGDRKLTNQYTKSGYPLGIMVNASGRRFVDEGADLRNYTYAIFGREVLKQPDGVAWQVWDADGAALLRKEEYDASVTSLLMADTIESLADKLVSSGLHDREQFLKTVTDFNNACQEFHHERPDVKFDPASRDGLSTQTSSSNTIPPKSNWARPLTNPPFTAVKVTCGITFTFGGLAVNPDTAEVLADDGQHHGTTPEEQPASVSKEIKGLYCCGEILGGLFWHNYPGGSGLTAGTVFGRIAGRHAAERALMQKKNG